MLRYPVLLISITVLAYLSSFGNTFVWDDLNNIANNEELVGPVRLKDIFLKDTSNSPAYFYRPFPYLTIYFDHFIWKENPFGYHLTNLFFHLLNVLLVFRLTKWLAKSDQIAFIPALLFAIHPVHTEAIAYISGRSDPICSFFLLGSFLFYLKFLDTAAAKRIVYLFSCLLLFSLGLLSKEIALIFPVIIFFYEFSLADSSLRLKLKRTVPFISGAIVFLLFRHFFVRGAAEVGPGRLDLWPNIFLFYLRLLLWPFHLHMQPSFQENDFLLMMPPFIAMAIILGLFILAIPRIVKNSLTLFGLGWFVIWLLPFLGFFKLNAELAEHWLYISSIGFFLVVSRWSIWRNKIVLSMVILFFSLLTIERQYVWHDDISIYRDTLRYRPEDPRLHYNLGNAYLRRGLLDNASQEYSIAIQQNPNYAYALNNLGLVMEKQKSIREAGLLYEKACGLAPELKAAKKNLARLRFSDLAFAGEISFEHSLYGEVLDRFLMDGQIDYMALKRNPSLLDNYLKKIAELNPLALDSMSGDEKKSFYINSYNALTLKVITEHYPVKSIKDIPGVWDKIKFIPMRKLPPDYHAFPWQLLCCLRLVR